MSHVIFYGINGVGLGHIARLSVIQRHLNEHSPAISTHALCRSSMGSLFFTCPCTEVGARGRDLGKALGIRGISGTMHLLQSRFIPSKRKTVIFDSMWSKRVLKLLRRGKYQTILIMESFKPDNMYETLRDAFHYFDYIFFPCQPEELAFHYQSHEKLWSILQHQKFQAVGPFVRSIDKSDNSEKVIFTLGGGGEHVGEDPKYSIQGYLEQYIKAANILHQAGKKNLFLAKGPLMEVNIDLGPLKLLDTMKLPEHFGPNTTVVTRGTYNLTWEAIAQGAKLVTTRRSTVLLEHAESRNQFLKEQGYAYYTELDGEALAEAILQGMPANLCEAQNLVTKQAGLDTICTAFNSFQQY